ncbi:hypothetical protein F511_26705 [Dorcoceras hygrometricum]|uniref:Uncharacterized protein n=1 Tax=Dorcoceras hygrometricum TaxID=472368 RepID=A0A2Z7BYI5_9LAMI|nr:hypothetical protein F511_26705 [Dorcoceras hygrometricum]
MVSMKNPFAAILDSNRFTGLNYQDWLRNLNLILASEKLLYTIEKSPPDETPACISPEELITLKQWREYEHTPPLSLLSPPPPPPCAAAANFAGICSGLVFRGESVHADLVRTSSAV